MKRDMQETIEARLQQELISGSPDVWTQIHKELAHRIVSELLWQLDELPSAEGRLFGEIRDAMQQTIRGA